MTSFDPAKVVFEARTPTVRETIWMLRFREEGSETPEGLESLVFLLASMSGTDPGLWLDRTFDELAEAVTRLGAVMGEVITTRKLLEGLDLDGD